MSTPYQVVYCNKFLTADVESEFRIYEKCDYENVPQYEWQFEILKHSMAMKVKASAIIGIIYVIFCGVYYEYVIL